jgi:hypothetical protein
MREVGGWRLDRPIANFKLTTAACVSAFVIVRFQALVRFVFNSALRLGWWDFATEARRHGGKVGRIVGEALDTCGGLEIVGPIRSPVCTSTPLCLCGESRSHAKAVVGLVNLVPVS